MDLTGKDIFLLDLDETLHDFPRAERENLKLTLQAFGIAADEAFYARFHAVNDMLWKALERGETTRAELKIKRFSIVFGELGICADVPAVAAAYYKNFSEVCFPYDGAKEFLEQLYRRGRVFIVTNGGSEIQRRHLKDAGFLPYLAGVFISEEIGFDKPSREYADYVAAHIAGFARARAVWLGDSLTSDGACAARMGVDFVRYGTDGENAVKTYAQFLQLLQK